MSVAALAESPAHSDVAAQHRDFHLSDGGDYDDMGLPRTVALALLILITTTASETVFASAEVDFAHCAGTLDDVSTNADEAASKAREAESAEEEFASEKEDYDRCRRFPEIYDFLQDGCRNKRREAENAREELESAIEDLTSALNELDRSMSDVQSACGYSLVPTTPVMGVTPGHQGICAKLRRLKGSMKAQEISDLCKRVMTTAECGACLGGP